MMNDTRRHWDEIRVHGKGNFIIQYGLRRFALPVGIAVWLVAFVMIPVLYEIRPSPNYAYLLSREFFLSVVAGLLLWPIGGYVWAVWTWARREREYQRS